MLPIFIVMHEFKCLAGMKSVGESMHINAAKDSGIVNDGRIHVWNLQIRIFHWFLVFGFLISYCAARFHLKTVHVWTGYFLCILLLSRIYWGIFGVGYARFSTFIFSPQESIHYMQSMWRPNSQHYVGHNPAGALMVFTLLALLILLLGSGIVVLSVIDYEGPLVGLGNLVSDHWSYGIRKAHDMLASIILAMAGLHVLGVVLASAQHGENLVLAMFTGWKVLPRGKPELEEITRNARAENET
jgi:cytochrome b